MENIRELALEPIVTLILHEPIPHRPQIMRYIRVEIATIDEVNENMEWFLLQKIQRAQPRLQTISQIQLAI